MKLKNLILTSTVGMSREKWLNFRKPLNHVLEFIRNANQGLDSHSILQPNEHYYEGLKILFQTEAWKNFIFPCIGGSEIASAMGLNQYKSVIELYYEKVGIKPTVDIDNAAMFWGRELEEQVAEKWQYWNGNVEEMIANFTSDNLIRKCRRINAYMQNKEFAWIFVSLDRVINKGKNDEEGCLECKTISGFAADMWEIGIPPMYIVQLQTQCGVGEFPYGEIAILRDGRNFDVLPFERNEEIIKNIIVKSQHFFGLVKKGIENYILSMTCPTEWEQTRLDHLAEIDKLAPEPDGSVSYENYLKENKKDKGLEIDGTEEHYELGIQFLKYKVEGETIETKQRECSNKLKAALGEASVMLFGDDRGKITWKANVKGSRLFKVGLKVIDINEGEVQVITAD